MALDRIWVIPHPRVENRVAIAEKHPEHPLNQYGEHEVYVAKGTGPVEVAVTPEVNRLLSPSNGLLVRVDGQSLSAARELHDKEQDERQARRTQLLLEQRQAETSQIGDATRKANELELRVAELQARIDGFTEVSAAQAIADRERVRADAAIAEANRRADEAIAAVEARMAEQSKPADAPVSTVQATDAAPDATPPANPPAETTTAESKPPEEPEERHGQPSTAISQA